MERRSFIRILNGFLGAVLVCSMTSVVFAQEVNENPFVPPASSVKSFGKSVDRVNGEPIPKKVNGDYLTTDEANTIVEVLRGIYHDDNDTHTVSDDKLGILTNSPDKTLDVNGDLNFRDNLYKNNILVEFGHWISSTLGLHYGVDDESFGRRVGIGTSSPIGTVEVQRTGDITPLVVSKGNRNWKPLDEYDVAIGDGTSSNAYWGIKAGNLFSIGKAANRNLFRIDANGNIGIGATPIKEELLVVNGNVVADDPTEDEHLATKWYVDQRVSEQSEIALNYVGNSGGGGTVNNTTLNSFNDWNPLKVKAISAGGNNTCAVLTDGTVKCWGDNGFGQLGGGDRFYEASASSPIAVQGLKDVIDIEVGNSSVCALKADHTVWCWGANFASGAYPYSTYQGVQLTPVFIKTLSDVKSIDIISNQTCFSFLSGGIKCLGTSYEAPQLGMPTLTPIVGIDDNLMLGLTGIFGGCSVDTNGNTKCWHTESATPYTAVSPISLNPTNSAGMRLGNIPVNGIISMSEGCFVSQTGMVDCLTGTIMPEISTAMKVSGTNDFGCALLTDKSVSCWDLYTPPALVGGGNQFKEISAGSDHICGILVDDTAVCWGDASEGRLGNSNSTNNQFYPVKVTDQKNSCPLLN